MLIHSITPGQFLQQPELPELTMKRTAFGYVEGYEQPGGFCVQRIHTTDLTQYLNKDYTPGATIDNGQLTVDS
jgi:hypothetical protein